MIDGDVREHIADLPGDVQDRIHEVISLFVETQQGNVAYGPPGIGALRVDDFEIQFDLVGSRMRVSGVYLASDATDADD